MGDIRQRRWQANYLDIGAEGIADIQYMGAGYTTLNEEPSAQVSDKRYICDASSTKQVTGYEASNPFTADDIQSDPTIAHIADVAKNRRTGSAAEADYYRVDLTGDEDLVAGGVTSGEFPARKVRVSIEVSSFSDEDGECTIEGNLNEIGDIVAGLFDTTTRTFTPAVIAD